MMNKLKRLLLILVMLTSVAACQAGPMNKESVSEEFIDLFDYEIQNRVFALNSMKATVTFILTGARQIKISAAMPALIISTTEGS
jgi:hypothetical protein